MDGIHDLGGKQGFGPVRYTLNAHGVPRALGSARQRALRATRCAGHLQHGRVPPCDRAHGAAPLPHRELLRALAHEPRHAAASRRASSRARSSSARAGGTFPLATPSAPGRTNVAARERFKPGDRVRVRSSTSCPATCACRRYIRGKTGVVVGESPAYPFPDAHAHGVEAAGRADLRRALPQPRTCGRTRPIPRWCTSGVFQSYLERAD